MPCINSLSFFEQGAHSNQEECLRLAERVTQIIFVIMHQMADRKDAIPADLQLGLKQLLMCVSPHIRELYRLTKPIQDSGGHQDLC